MTGLLGILAALFLAGIVLVILLLVMPVRILAHGSGDTDDGFDFNGRVMPFAGLCGIGFRYISGAQRLELYLGSWCFAGFGIAQTGERFRWAGKWFPARRKPEKTETVEKKGFGTQMRGLRNKAAIVRPLIGRVVREVVRLVRFDRFRADIRFGLGDPALTGMLAGIVYAVNGVLPSCCTIIPSWNFTRIAAGGEIDVDISILNYRFWGALMRLAPDMLRMRRALAGATS